MIIDVSQHNGAINWEKVKPVIEGVILRMGYTGYGSGAITYDKRYKENQRAVSELAIPYGVYYFPQSITADEARAEADFIYKEVKDKKLALGVWLDSEIADTKLKAGRADNLTRASRTEFLHIIIERLKGYGIACGVYASTSWLNYNLDMAKLKGVPVWCAQYNTECKYKGSYIMWQYSSKGSIPGIVGNVDLNVLHVEPVQETDTELDNAVEVIARRVIAGRFGEGHENRKNSIYALIRQKVNDII